MSLISELKRRNDIRMAGLYLVGVAFVGGTLVATVDESPKLGLNS